MWTPWWVYKFTSGGQEEYMFCECNSGTIEFHILHRENSNILPFHLKQGDVGAECAAFATARIRGLLLNFI